MEKWQTDFNNYDESYIDPLKFLFDQAEKRLRWGLEVADRITARCYLIMAAIIPLMTVLVSVLGRYYIVGEIELKKLVGLCWMGMGISFFVVALLLLVLFPRLMHQVGAQPKDVVRKEVLDNPEVGISSAKTAYIVSLLNEIESHQERIDYTENQNASRIFRFKLALMLVISGFVFALSFIAYHALT